MEVCCGPLKFSGNFDSGNLGTVELVKSCEDGVPEASPLHLYGTVTHYEVNIRSRQDCAGTNYANGNRTWFYFGIKGGQSNAVIKLNILNLNKQTKLFEQGMQPVMCCIPEKPKWTRIRDRVVILCGDGINVKDHSCGISFRVKLPVDTRTSTLFVAFTYPFSYHNLTSWLNEVDNVYSESSPTPRSDSPLLAISDVYYKRETVCLSLEGRPVDLLTITSTEGLVTKSREPYLENLFPYRDQPRCYKFLNKKIVFLSSRVHPGETPAQFVMNGAIKFLLEEKDPRARMLRRLFVFKLIPMLNPDGVFRGHYRTDPRGVNLNRVYLQPNPTLHPTIYAARKLILYAHLGHDQPDDYEFENENQSVPGEQKPDLTDESMNFNESATDAENNRLCAGCIELSENSILESEIRDILAQEDDVQLLNSKDTENIPVIPHHHEPMKHSLLGTGLLDEHLCTFESCDEDSVVDHNELRRNSSSGTEFRSPQSFPSSSSASSASLVTAPVQLKVGSPGLHPSSQRLGTDSTFLNPPPEIKVKASPTTKRKKRSQPLPPPPEKSQPEVESGLYAYIDFHGHATKRGIFIYGNHFNDIAVQTECMILPRLMALNCQHFDFSACNFTEKLMTMRDRRDGASREGSGRVAVLKLTGLVKSYTLECNYNTGRMLNHLITRSDSHGFVDPLPVSIHPPKYTPEIFEAVGKSLLESVLDSTDLNPWSRLKSTEFRNLDGLRSFLRRRLEHSIEYQYQSTPFRTANPVPSGIKSSLNRPQSPGKSASLRGKSYSIPNSPSLKNRAGSSKIFKMNPSSPPSSSSGPLIPKKDNQTQTSRPLTSSAASLKSGISKMSKTLVHEKPTSSSSLGAPLAKGPKTRLPKSKSLPVVGPDESTTSGLVPSSSSSTDNRTSATTKLHKPSTSTSSTTTKKKKKTIKRKSKKGTKTLKRPESN